MYEPHKTPPFVVNNHRKAGCSRFFLTAPCIISIDIPKAALAADGDVLAQSFSSARTVDVDDMRHLVPSWRIFEVLHPNPTLETVDLLYHGFDQTSEHLECESRGKPGSFMVKFSFQKKRRVIEIKTFNWTTCQYHAWTMLAGGGGGGGGAEYGGRIRAGITIVAEVYDMVEF
ncbi:hypothetical protein B0H10DRAFT_1961879 [Mycena sp. CBHHK59/15]|nr:hypothetical protein B0H10DRAFT_1961879 [Mycena sp. CBHHK59/15]